jgi:hypothetical protein
MQNKKKDNSINENELSTAEQLSVFADILVNIFLELENEGDEKE